MRLQDAAALSSGPVRLVAGRLPSLPLSFTPRPCSVTLVKQRAWNTLKNAGSALYPSRAFGRACGGGTWSRSPESIYMVLIGSGRPHRFRGGKEKLQASWN